MSAVFFNDTATTEIYTLSLHDALPIYAVEVSAGHDDAARVAGLAPFAEHVAGREQFGVRDGHEVDAERSEEHTSELQSRQYLVCRLLLEKKNQRCLTQPSGLSRHALTM